MKSSPIIRKAQAGFTLIELIVVIVILGILAATALPRMFDMSGQARLAKMQGAVGSVRAAASSAHAQWLVNGGQQNCDTCGAGNTEVMGTAVVGEGTPIPMWAGYPDVGGDGATNDNAATSDTGSGIVIAAGLNEPDYQLDATATVLTVVADAAHPRCRFTYTQATQAFPNGANSPPVATAPQINTADLTAANCN